MSVKNNNRLTQTILLKTIEENRIKKGIHVFTNNKKPDCDVRIEIKTAKQGRQYALMSLYASTFKKFKYIIVSIVNDTVYLELTDTYDSDYCYSITTKGQNQAAVYTKISGISTQLLSSFTGKYKLIPYYTSRNLYYLSPIK